MTPNKYFILWTLTFLGVLFGILAIQVINEMYLSNFIFSSINLTIFCVVILCWSIYACAYMRRSRIDYYTDFSLVV
jgi:hypothetical protein